jgi:endonuclease/exonuclease/phosphatase family metal-dependent hydrolase
VEEQQTTDNYRVKRSPTLSDILRNYKYCDVFSYLHPRAREYTFHRAGVAQSRLDRVYCPPGLETSLVEVAHVPGLSDHSGVMSGQGWMSRLCSSHLPSAPTGN